MKRYAIPLFGLGLLLGCETEELGRVGEQPRETLTYAATAQYPGNPQMSEQMRTAVLVNHGRKQMAIYNLTPNAIPASTLWVNGAFLRRIGSIPPRGHIVVHYSSLAEAGSGTRDFSQVDQSVERVELQTPQGLFTVQGPANW